MTANYIISLDCNQIKKSSKATVGKVRSNYLGTMFNLYDNGKNPKKTNNKEEIRSELGVVTYVFKIKNKDYNILGFSGPRKMKVYLPEVVNNKIAVYKGDTPENKIYWKYKNEKDTKIKRLKNKEPVWSESIVKY